MSETERKMPGLVSVPAAAERLGVSAATVRVWLRQRRLPYVRLGRRVLIAWETLARFVTENEVR